MQNIRKMGALLGAGAVIFTLAGCSSKTADQASTAGDAIANTASSAGSDATNAAAGAGAAVSNGAAEAGAAASNVAAGAANAASNAGAAISNTAAGAAQAVSGAGAAAVLTPKIKTALGTYNSGPLKGSKIDVDTNGTTNTVTLKGTVKSAAQKTLAEATAKKNAPGYKINNTLTVAK